MLFCFVLRLCLEEVMISECCFVFVLRLCVVFNFHFVGNSLRYIRIKMEDYFSGITLLILVCYKLEHRIEERNLLLFHHWPIFGFVYHCSLFNYRTSCLRSPFEVKNVVKECLEFVALFIEFL
ncbi:hypothetical protein S245_013296 [Arachis hypogaea]